MWSWAWDSDEQRIAHERRVARRAMGAAPRPLFARTGGEAFAPRRPGFASSFEFGGWPPGRSGMQHPVAGSLPG